jgi:drug/metabolite transporter (DMT)-like permease
LPAAVAELARRSTDDATSTTSRETGRLPPAIIACLAILYVVWGSTYLALRVVVNAMPALLTAGARYVVAGVVLYAVARSRGAARPTAKQWWMSALAGAGTFLVGNGCVAWAEKTVASGLAAIVCATTPLWLTLMGAATGSRPGRRELAGLLVGFAGVVVAMWQGLGTAGAGALVVGFAPIGWAAGSLVARRGHVVDGGLAAAMQMIAGGAQLVLAGGIAGETPAFPTAPAPWIALAWLVVMGSLVAFSAYTYLLRRTTPALATSYAYVNPFVALGLGAVLGGEALGRDAALGCVLAAAGVALVVAAPKKRAGASSPARAVSAR